MSRFENFDKHLANRKPYQPNTKRRYIYKTVRASYWILNNNISKRHILELISVVYLYSVSLIGSASVARTQKVEITYKHEGPFNQPYRPTGKISRDEISNGIFNQRDPVIHSVKWLHVLWANIRNFAVNRSRWAWSSLRNQKIVKGGLRKRYISNISRRVTAEPIEYLWYIPKSSWCNHLRQVLCWSDVGFGVTGVRLESLSWESVMALTRH